MYRNVSYCIKFFFLIEVINLCKYLPRYYCILLYPIVLQWKKQDGLAHIVLNLTVRITDTKTTLINAYLTIMKLDTQADVSQIAIEEMKQELKAELKDEIRLLLTELRQTVSKSSEATLQQIPSQAPKKYLKLDLVSKMF